jgi:multifunctional beta-oxidation protein
MQAEDRSNRKYLNKIYEAMQMKGKAATYSYTDRDSILYNLGIGAKRRDLNLVFEGADNFEVLPTFGVVPTYFAEAPFSMSEMLPNFDKRMLLHGEQYLEIKQFPIPTSGILKSTTSLIEVVDKGNAAIVRRGNTTTDESGKPVFYNESVAFIRNSGGFGGGRKPADRGAATASNDPPSRSPDKVVEETTSEDLAALYRLMGDYNPLHIDPAFSKVG